MGSGSLPTLRVLGFGVSNKKLEQAVRELQLPVSIVREADEADAVITLRNYFKQKAPAIRESEERGLPIFVLKSNTLIQLESALTSIFALEVDPREAALREVVFIEDGPGDVRIDQHRPGIRVAQVRCAARLDAPVFGQTLDRFRGQPAELDLRLPRGYWALSERRDSGEPRHEQERAQGMPNHVDSPGRGTRSSPVANPLAPARPRQCRAT